MQLLDGKKLAEEIRNEISVRVHELTAKHSIVPCLAAVLVGDDPASQVYVSNKEKACEKIGIRSVLHRLPETTGTDKLLQLVNRLNNDKSVHGILVQLPLPKCCDTQKVLDAI